MALKRRGRGECVELSDLEKRTEVIRPQDIPSSGRNMNLKDTGLETTEDINK